MRLCTLASGSSGNAIYVGTDSTHLLVDAGISKKRVEEGLGTLGLKGEDIDGILVTHEHSDHISGLGVFSRKYKVPIYATKGTLEGIRASKTLGKLPDGLFREIQTDKKFSLGDMDVKAFDISHDAAEPCAYRIESDGKKVAIATDMGLYDDYIIENLKELDSIVLEANHDIKMLEVGPYPYYLKKRIAGDKGHLSNENSGRLLCDILNDHMKAIILGHLSKENNFSELALETVRLEVSLGDNPYKGKDLPIRVAERTVAGRPVEI